MPQQFLRVLIPFCLMLAACTSTDSEHDHNLFDFSSHKPPKPKPAEPRYCYKTYEDIICYGKPIPGDEERLVGYQDANGKTGYTLPGKIPHATTTTEVTTVQHTSLPVPGGPSADDATTDGKQLKEIIFDPSELEPKELVPDKPQ